MKVFLSIAFLGVLFGRAVGQAAETNTYPVGALLVKAPPFSKWTVTITSVPKGGSNTAGGPAIVGNSAPAEVIVTTIKTYPIRLVTVPDPKKGNSTIWCEGPFEVFQNDKIKKPMLVSAGNQSFIDYSRSDFPELQWIAQSNFVSLQKSGGRQVLQFRTQTVARAPGQAANDHEVDITNEANIDAVTRLPISSQTGDQHLEYNFEQRPDSTLSLPPEIKSVIDQEQVRLKRLARPPPRG